MVMGVKTDAISAKMDRLEPPWPAIKPDCCKLPMTSSVTPPARGLLNITKDLGYPKILTKRVPLPNKIICSKWE